MATVGFPDIGFNAKTQGKLLYSLRPGHLCVFALIFSVGAGCDGARFGVLNKEGRKQGTVFPDFMLSLLNSMVAVPVH